MRRLGGLGLALVLLAACGGGSGKDGYKVVTNAASATADAGPARLSMTVDAGSVNVKADGVADLKSKVLSIHLSVPGAGELTMLGSGTTMYMKLPAAAMRQMGATTTWAKIDTARSSEALAGISGGLGSQDPGDTLAALAGTSKDGVHTLGREDVRGVGTTHYRADIDLTKASQHLQISDPQRFKQFMARFGSKETTEDVWLDDAGVVRRLAMQMSLASLDTRITMEFYDFGKVATPAVPSAGDTTDVTDQVIAQVQRAEQRQPGPPAPR